MPHMLLLQVALPPFGGPAQTLQHEPQFEVSQPRSTQEPSQAVRLSNVSPVGAGGGSVSGRKRQSSTNEPRGARLRAAQHTSRWRSCRAAAARLNLQKLPCRYPVQLGRTGVALIGELLAMIRLATVEDVTAIAGVHVRTWQAAYRGHMPDAYLAALDPAKRAAMWTENLAEPKRLLFVALEAETIVGFCSFRPSRDAEAAAGVGEISAIYVEPGRWRGGHGSALAQAALLAARERGYSAITLWVLEANAPARAFYEARGFVLDGATKTSQLSGATLAEVRYRRPLG